ncbi:MAG: Mur ligase family protein [Candidatus Curtissbacteria bacterium]|nr:Mur ligase family protein [Candidatus Curtissbacteria bacterium]
MFNLNVYQEVKSWKKPIHLSKTLAAKSYLKLLKNIDVIGITGSVGKTLTQNAIVAVLTQKYKVITPDENLDPTFRIPQTILATKPWHQKLVLEYGVERKEEMNHYLFMVTPNIAVVTVISPTHLKYFSSIEGVYKEKVKLVEALPKSGKAVLNADDPMVVKMSQHTKAQVFWYGKKAKNGVKISHFTQNTKGSKFRMHYGGQKASVSWKIIGEHQLTSAYAAATVGVVNGLTLKQIAKGLSQIKTPVHRLNPITTKNISIIDDTYNSSPKAAAEAIDTLQNVGKRKPKIAVLGEMKDLGTKSEHFHAQIGIKIAKSKINYLVTVGKVAEIIATAAKKNGFGGKIIKVATSQEAIKAIKKIINPKTIVLVKGSRHAHLERIVSGLLHKSTVVNCYHCGVLK